MYKSFKKETKWRDIENRISQSDRYPIIGILLIALEMAILATCTFLMFLKIIK
jgi:hypothetical protein